MLGRTFQIASIGILSTLSLAVFANNHHETWVVAPNCLVNKITLQTTDQVIAKDKRFTLLKTNEVGIENLSNAKHHSSCGGFVDVTDDYQQSLKKTKGRTSANTFLNNFLSSKTSMEMNYTIQYEKQVNQLLNQLNPTAMWSDLTDFSNTASDAFPDRSAATKTGVKAANWLKNKIETMAREHNRSDIKTYFVETGRGYIQPSLVVKIGESNEPAVVIGAHMDTLTSRYELKPGADDDGSGSMTSMAVARSIIDSGLHFKRPLYFIWYAAEEVGLVGSKSVVTDFKNKHIPVHAVLQLDMTGYAYKNEPTIWLSEDYVSNKLTKYLATLINTYVKKPIAYTRCGYACSDHASWNKAGFNVAFPMESAMEHDNPYIHTSRDKMDILSVEHMTDYAKLGIAFAVELAGPA